MADSNVLDRMRQDWNERAREDAHYYVAFGRREQDDAEFLRHRGGCGHAACEASCKRLRLPARR